ncbi:MAG: large subunit ribosomal protein L25 [Spirochaetes bacterium]|nr:MAG: large subunit ribosomal protein L25 [Spirochaetota bacterium]
MDHFVLHAFNRAKTTKGELNTFRKEGKLPAVIYGAGKDAANLFVYTHEYEKALKSITESTIITLDIEGKKVNVFVKEHQREAVSKSLLHIDFLEFQEGKILHAHVRIRLRGTPKGVVSGGVLENPTHEVEVACDPSVLPEHIDLDITSLEVNHAIHVRDIPAMEGVKILANPDTVIAAVKYARHEATAAAPTAEATPAATPEAPETAKA